MTQERFFVVLLLAMCFSREKKNKKCAIPFVQMELGVCCDHCFFPDVDPENDRDCFDFYFRSMVWRMR